MIITEYSFVMAVLWSSIFIILLTICKKNSHFICIVGVPAILLLFAGFIVRVLLPVEFPFVTEIRFRGVIASINTMMLNDIAKGIGIPVYKILVFIWITVSVILMIYRAMQYFRYTKGIRKLNSRTSDQILTCKQVIEKELGGMRAEIICSPVIKVPMCTGLIKKLILLPGRLYKEDELYYILKHEYTHLKNKDIYIKLLIEVFIALFWWNPAVYLLRHNLGHMLEIRCDLAVIEGEASPKRATYLSTIINTLKDDCKQKNHFKLGTAELADSMNKRKIKQRFHVVVDYGENKRKQRVCSHIFALLFFITLFSSYIFVIQPAYDPPPSDINNEGYTETTPESAYIVEMKDGKYILVNSNGKRVELSEDMKNLMVENGFGIRKEK